MKAHTQAKLMRLRFGCMFWVPAFIGMLCTWGMIGVLVAGVKVMFF